VEIKELKKTKDTLEFKLLGERHTLPQLLKRELLKDPSVEFVSYKLNHPLDKDSQFIVKMKSGSPKSALSEAAKKIGKEAGNFSKELEKAIK